MDSSNHLQGLAAAVTFLACLSAAISAGEVSLQRIPHSALRQLNHRTLTDFINGYANHTIHTSPFNTTITHVLDIFGLDTEEHHQRSKRSPEAFYLYSLFKIMWQFVNGLAKPFLKTYLVPIQMLFTYMAPKMFLRDCFKVDTPPLLGARAQLSPFTVRPAAQAFFTCAVDIISQLILCVKLLANMAPSIF